MQPAIIKNRASIARVCREGCIFAEKFKFTDMAKEIERKYLVTDDSYRSLAASRAEISQGYISAEPDHTVRVRISGSRGFITVKTRNIGAVRNEWEYEIPLADARAMLAAACSSVLSKTRYIVPATDGLRWEVEEFHGCLDGLVVAEIELPREDYPVDSPAFIGREVTGDTRYYNSNLAAQV